VGLSEPEDTGDKIAGATNGYNRSAVLKKKRSSVSAVPSSDQYAIALMLAPNRWRMVPPRVAGWWRPSSRRPLADGISRSKPITMIGPSS